MMKRKWKSILIIAFMIMIFIPTTGPVIGEEVHFSVKALLPENQVDRTHSYFDLQVTPGENQTLETEIFNHEQEDITVKISVRNATTNQNGIIVYEETEADNDELFRLTNMMTIDEEEIVIRAGESTVTTVNLRLPEKAFEGVVLGGLHFEKVEKNEKVEQAVAIENKYAYVIGVQLRESDTVVKPELSLVSIEPELINNRAAGVITLQNKTPVIMKDLAFDAKIYKEGKTDVWKEKHQEKVNMAPTSTMDFLVDWENDRLEAGTYDVELTIKHPSRTWEWRESFTVEKEEAKQINTEAIGIVEPKVNKLIIGVGIVLIGIIIGLLYYIRKLKRI